MANSHIINFHIAALEICDFGTVDFVESTGKIKTHFSKFTFFTKLIDWLIFHL